jgi:hypothetical protein
MPKHLVAVPALILLVAFVLLAVAGCTRSPSPLPPTPAAMTEAPAFVTLPPEQVIPQLIAAERDASRRSDLALLAQLWAPDARIVDGRGTPENGDDLVWAGRAAILDRYTVAVFLSPPPPFASPPAPELSVSGDTATARLGNDTWQFTRQDDRWWLAELAY